MKKYDSVTKIGAALIVILTGLLIAGETKKTTHTSPVSPPTAVEAPQTNAIPVALHDLDETKARIAKAKPPPAHPPAGRIAPEDPRVTACKTAHADKGWKGPDGLEACLETLKHTPVLAPGKLGAARPPIQCPAQDIADWYFSSTGNNGNSCVDAGHPCDNALGPQEVQSRWGCGAGPVSEPTLTVGMTLHMKSDMLPSSAFTFYPTVAESGGGIASANIVCDTTTIATGLVLSGVVSKSHGADQALNANLGASASTSVGFQIVNTDRGSSLAWVDSIVGGADGGTPHVVLITQPIDPGSGTEVDTWANGDHVNILRPGQLWLQQETGLCTTVNCAGLYPSFGSQPSIKNCWVPPSNVGSVEMTSLTNVRVDNSRFDSAINVDNTYLHNSLVTYAPAAWRSSTMRAGSITNAGTPSPLIGGIPIVGASDNEGNWWLDDIIVHGSVNESLATSLSIDSAYCDHVGQTDGQPFSSWNILGFVFPTTVEEPKIYGHCVIDPEWGGVYTFLATSAAVFGGGGVTLAMQQQTNALAWDFGHTPVLPYVRALTVSSLFASFASGGFDGIASPNYNTGGFVNWGAPALSVGPSVVWTTGQGGTGLDAGCPANAQVIGAGASSALTCGPTLSTCSTGQLVVGNNSCSSTPTSGQVAQFSGASSPAGLTGLLHWIKQDAGLTLSGSNVTSWADQSGNALDVTDIGAQPPTFNASGGPGGTGRVTFTATQYLQQNTNMTSSGHARTTWLVLRNTAGVGSGGVPIQFARSDPSLQFYWAGSGGRILTDALTFTNSSTYTDDGNFHLAEYDYVSGSQTLFYVDGTSQSVSGGAAGSESGTAGFLIGGGRGLSQGIVGDIAEEFTIDHLASSTERNNMGAYIHGRYGLTIAGAAPGGWTGVTMSGDATMAPGGAVTLSSVGSAGSCGDATHSCQVTFDAKGRETAENNVAISFPGSAVTSVTGAGATSCSPTTGAVVCTTSSSGITAVNGTAPISCSGSPTATCSLNTSGVTAGAYGDATHVGQFVVQANGTISAAANVLITPPPPLAAFAARASATATASVTDINSATITIPSGQKCSIWIWFDIGPNTDGLTLSDDMLYGYGDNSSSAFTVFANTTIPAHVGSAAVGQTSATLVGQITSAGSHTVHALAQVPSGGAVSNPVAATIMLQLTQ